jgi:flagellar basal body-associated protein FliL
MPVRPARVRWMWVVLVVVLVVLAGVAFAIGAEL